MPGLKVFGLFIFLIVFSETGAQITEPAWVQSAIPEDPDGKALSEQSSENITHINSDKLNGHLESKSLEVVPSWFEKSAEKYSTEVGYDNAAVSENSQSFDSALVENYKDDDILSFDSLSSTDRASYDEGTATKGLTDGFEHRDVINDSATSGDSVAVHGEYANGDENYKFVNDYESSTTDESIFSSSYSDDENDKELFESYDPIDGEWFKQDDATTRSYYHDDALLKRIEELFAQSASQTAATDIDNDWERIFSETTQKVDIKEDESILDSEAINKSEYENIDSTPSYFVSILSDVSETVVSPLDDTVVGNDADIDTAATASSNTGDQENDEVHNISVSIDSSISTKLNSNRNDENEAKPAEIITENNWNDDDEKRDIETTSQTILLRSTEPESKTEKDDEIEESNESVNREDMIVVDNQESQTPENFDKSTSLSEESLAHISEQINEPTLQRTEDYGIETTTSNEYSSPLVTTVKNLNEDNEKIYILKKSNIEDDDENVPVEESNEEFAEKSITSTTEEYKVYKTIDYDYSNEKNDTDSVESSTEAVTENLFKIVTSDFMNNIAQETDNALVTDRNVFENYETENQKNKDAVNFNEPTTQSVVYVSNTDVVEGQGPDNSEETIEPTDTTSEYGAETNVNNKNEPIVSTIETGNEEISTAFYEANPSDDNLHPNKNEGIMEPTETLIEEYVTETNVNNDKDISSTVESKYIINEEFSENEPIVSTTEADNEEVSTEFDEANPSNENLYPNKAEETTQPNETHIEEYDTESTVEIKDRSKEFSENEHIVSTTEADNEEVSTEFYEANPSNDNLHPNKAEETTETTETHIEEYGTESTVATNDRSEEFSEIEPIVSTTEADNEEVSTKFDEANPSNDNLHPNKSEETTEPIETHIEEYGTESTVATNDRSEEFSENEPIVSTTEADNEEVITKFDEANPSNDNLHPKKSEETTEPIETHIEEYGTESTVATKDRSEEFSENEPIVSTTEADNEEVNTEFYKANPSNDNLHPNKAEETTEPTETHIEEYGTESTVETKDGSEEFSENEPIVSTTEPNKAEETTEPTETHIEENGTESTVETKDGSEEFSENESIVSTTEAGSDDDSTEFYEMNSSDNLHYREEEEKELVENTTITRAESTENLTNSTIRTIITTTAIPRETHNAYQFFETNRVTTTSTESNDNILTTIIYKSNNENKSDVSIEAMKGIEKFLQEELEESTTETYNKETTTISYETSSKGYNYKEKEERQPVESTMSVLMKKEIKFYFTDSTTEEIVSTTATDSDAKDNYSNGAEAEKHLQEEEEISVEESTTSISIEEKTVKYFTDGETEEVLTTTEMSEEDENFSENNLEEIDEPTSQRIGTFTEDDGRDATVNNAADFKEDSNDISTTSKYEFLKENSEEKDVLFESSTKKYSIDKESFNEEGESDFLESTSVSIKEDITSSFIDNSESNTTEKIVFIPEIENEMHSMQTESNEYFSKDVDVTESSDYVTVENSFITTETFTDTRQVTEEIPIEATSSSLDINKNDLLHTESNIDYTNTTDDNEMNETVSTTHTFSEDYSDADDIVIENESRGSTQNEENVVTTEKENTEKINIETTTVLSLQGEKNLDLEITKIFDSVNDNITKLINDSIKKLSRRIEATPTVNNSFTTSDSSEDYAASISSEESTEKEKVKFSSNEVSAVNVSNRWSTFDITSLGGRNHDYDQSVEEYEDSNENKTVTPYMEEFEPYIKANVFGKQANVSIKIEIEDDSFHVPSNAHFDDDSDKHILNITWPSSHMQLNNSILLTLKENPELYVIQGAQLNLVEGDDFDIWNENFIVVQENSTFGKTNFVVELEDDARIYFSNLDFLRIAESDSNDVPSIPSAMKIDTKEIGIATGCIAAALFVCATIYFIISRSRKRVVHIEELSKNDIPV